MRTPFSLAIVSLPAFASVAQAHGSQVHPAATLPFGLDAAHLHLLTNHVPIFITFSGLIVLVLGLWWKNEAVRRAALVLLLTGIAGGILT